MIEIVICGWILTVIFFLVGFIVFYLEYEERYNEKCNLAEELEEVLFLVTDILHDEYKRSLFTQDELSYILTNARLFTRYGRVSIGALQDNPTFIKRDKAFIEYLKNDVWIKIYGRAFDTFQDIKDNL
ncbi:hypothetical protein [Arcobacter defluvii]|uniref:Uncharacterized protein n=1 Tax=Arcobacter defluvii TaxID=873191 RepID=A0AAE7BDU5_9BACT|nr:hypothetical protein [Arcobacter defluvii]QKF77278.1 hypothetical protein ADFLV_1246 [Arcobacter defluvii]QKF77878.1 hypothetical protein ADFLV_1860 [Arcobacter defluvii]RXI32659.1 hypothetical protein CP964_07275 [Arcobacter defluvii]